MKAEPRLKATELSTTQDRSRTVEGLKLCCSYHLNPLHVQQGCLHPVCNNTEDCGINVSRPYGNYHRVQPATIHYAAMALKEDSGIEQLLNGVCNLIERYF